MESEKNSNTSQNSINTNKQEETETKEMDSKEEQIDENQQESVDTQPDLKNNAIYNILHPAEKNTPKNRTQQKYYTNLIAIIVAAIGTFIAFASNLVPDASSAIFTLTVGLVVGSLGLIPRIGVALLEVLDTADKEAKNKEAIAELSKQLKVSRAAQKELIIKYHLDATYQSKWLNFGFNIATAMLSYTTAALIAISIKLDQKELQEKAQPGQNNQAITNITPIIRYTATGISIVLTAIFASLSARLEWKTTQHQKKLDSLKEEFQKEYMQKQIKAFYQSSFAEALLKLNFESKEIQFSFDSAIKNQTKIYLQRVQGTDIKETANISFFEKIFQKFKNFREQQSEINKMQESPLDSGPMENYDLNGNEQNKTDVNSPLIENKYK